jgi:hypothetical protein
MKKEKKTLLIGVVLGLFIALFYAHFFAPRYEIRKEGLSTMKLDKWTGQSWVFANNNWKKTNSTEENWEEVDKALSEALNIPFAKVDSASALKKLREKHPVLVEVPDDDLLERIKIVYSKKVLVNMYLGDFLRTNGEQESSESANKGKQ